MKEKRLLVQRVVLLLACVGAAHATVQARTGDWTMVWGSAQMAPYGTETVPAETFDGATLRETVHISTGGGRVRVRISNAFGREPLELESVRIAVKDGAAVELRFAGKTTVQVPAGAEYVSDPVALKMPLCDVVVTMEIAKAPAVLTVHAGARATAVVATGFHGAEQTLTPTLRLTRWYFLSGIEAESGGGSVVILGDSITDGHGTTLDGNDRWTDVLARRMMTDAGTRDMGVVNVGIGGNCILQRCIGESALERFDRDVLAQAGGKVLVVLEGVNDLGGLDRITEHDSATHEALVEALELALTQMAERAHAHGMRVVAGTVMPFGGSDYYHPSARTEVDRMKLNEWIRTAKVFDGVVDFDAAVRDPARPDRLLPEADSGDHLHPRPAGYAMMGKAVPLALLSDKGTR